MYKIIFSHQADKDKKLIKSAGLEEKTKKILNIVAQNLYDNSYSFEKLKGDLNNYFSRRINLHNRLVYSVDEEKKEVFVVRMWSHYNDVK